MYTAQFRTPSSRLPMTFDNYEEVLDWLGSDDPVFDPEESMQPVERKIEKIAPGQWAIGEQDTDGDPEILLTGPDGDIEIKV